jgi:CHAT domain-containing protein/tetratricopeptide (TPR) repeat protein
MTLIRKIRLLREDAPLQEFRRALPGNGWVELAGPEEPVDFLVTLSDDGSAYAVMEPDGDPVPRLRPPLKIGDPGAATLLVQRLVHLARYRATQELQNDDPGSPLHGGLVVELLGVQDDFDPVDKPDPRPFPPGPVPTLEPGQWTFLRIRNQASVPLLVSAFDLAPDWGITRFIPADGSSFKDLEPGEELVLPLRASLPEGYADATDILKVFATLRPVDLSVLELPPLDTPWSSLGAGRDLGGRGDDPLSRLLLAAAGDRQTRSLTVPASIPSQEWVTAQVDVRVRRAEDLASEQVYLLNETADRLFREREYERALATSDQASALARQHLGEKHPYLAQGLNLRAAVHLARGDEAAAELLLQQALNILRVADGARPQLATTLSLLSDLHVARGDEAAAEPLLQEALSAQRAALGDKHPGFAGTLSRLGSVRVALGDYEMAEPLLQQALDIQRAALGEAHPDVAVILSRLAEVWVERGDDGEAEPLLQQALDIQRAALGEAHPDVAVTLSRLADLRVERGGDPAEAESLVRRALEIREAALGGDHLLTARCLHRLGVLRTALGDRAGAEPLFSRAVQVLQLRLGEDHPEVAVALLNLAWLYATTDRAAQVLPLLDRVAAAHDGTTELALATGSRRRRLGCLRSLETIFEAFLSLVYGHLADSAAATRAALDRVLRFKGTAAEILAASPEAVLGGRYPALRSQLQELAGVRRRIAQKRLAGPGPEGGKAHWRVLQAWEADRQRLEAELLRQIPALGLARRLRTAGRDAVARALPSGSALVEFVDFRVSDFTAPGLPPGPRALARYLAFVLPAGSPEDVRMIDLGETAAIDRLASGLGTVLGRPGPPPRKAGRADSAAALRSTVFDPLRAALGGRRYLVLAPDGELSRVPFAALPTEEGGYLIDDYHFSYLHVGRDALRGGTESPGPPAESLVIADPDFDLQSDGAPPGSPGGTDARRPPLEWRDDRLSFGRFRATRGEAEKIAAMLGVSPWLGNRALEGGVKASRSPRILHLATQSYALPDPPPDRPATAWAAILLAEPGWGPAQGRGRRADNPMHRAGVALAGANSRLRGGTLPPEAEDGLLTAEEVSGLDLLATELVMLSAYATVSGEPNHQGLAGLQRAFLVAGARRLVMNLLPVNDRFTTDFMVEFYGRLLDKKPPAQALRETQLAVRGRAPTPRDWGAFVCLGDLSPLPALPTAFTPAISPYSVGLPAKGEIFFGRQDILKKVQDNLASSAGKNILVLRGQRRSGKTSVLYRLRDTLAVESRGAYLPAVVDVQGMRGIKSEGEFFWKLAHEMARDLKRHGLQVAEPPRSEYSAAPTSVFEVDFLEPLNDNLGSRRVLLMLDEFDKIKDLIDEGRVGQQVLEFLRHLMQHTPVLFLIAGTYKLREFTGGYWSVFFNLAVPIDIGALHESDARGLINEPVRLGLYDIDSSAVSEIIRVAGCHPYFTQLVCHELVAVRNRYKLPVVFPTYVAEAVEATLGTGDENIGFPWTEPDCSANERLVLAVLAREAGLPGQDGSAPLALVQSRLDEAGVSVAVGPAVKRLQDRDVLRQADDRLAFAVPLVRLWIARKHYDSAAAAQKYNAEQQAAATAGGTPHA